MVVVGGKLGIKFVFDGQRSVGVVGGAVVLKQPVISVMRTLKNCLEG